MPPVTSAAVPDTEPSPTTQPRAKAVPSSGSTNSKPAFDLSDPRPRENLRWRWDKRCKQWTVVFQGHTWFIGKTEDAHVWFLADIHRLNLFTQLSKAPQ
jgi:hypothetical protein